MTHHIATALKSRAAKVLTGSAVMFGSASAMATEAGPGETAIGELSSQASALIAAAWPVATTIMAGMIGIKLFKKFANRAS